MITGGSAFNIKAESLRLGDFTRPRSRLCWGSTRLRRARSFGPKRWRPCGSRRGASPGSSTRPAGRCASSGRALRLRNRPVAVRDVFEAREKLILRRDTHIDQLADKLMEPRVRRAIEPLLSGGDGRHSDRDAEYVRDLGLAAPDPPLRIANPIYGEVLPRVLTSVIQDEMPEQDAAWYVDAVGELDMDRLLAAFQKFWRRNSEHWIGRAQYREAGPHLVLQAFLHRVVNGRGRIEREYAGEPPGGSAGDLASRRGRRGRFVVECKLVKDGRPYARTVERGLEQTTAYMDLSDAGAGHLVVFDVREGKSWKDACTGRSGSGTGNGSWSGERAGDLGNDAPPTSANARCPPRRPGLLMGFHCLALNLESRPRKHAPHRRGCPATLLVCRCNPAHDSCSFIRLPSRLRGEGRASGHVRRSWPRAAPRRPSGRT